MPIENLNRRSMFGGFLGIGALLGLQSFAGVEVGHAAQIASKDTIKITKLETFYVKPRWLLLKIHTDAGIVGLGDATLESREETCAAAVAELGRYLIGQDPRQVLKHWQAMYRSANPYRGGPILMSAISGVDQALWDITGKSFGVPVWKLLGGPIRDRVRVYWDTLRLPPSYLQEKIREGFTAFKAAPMEYAGTDRPSPMPNRDTPAYIDAIVENATSLRNAIGKNREFAVHIGEASYRSTMQIITACEPLDPMFFEIHANNYNYDAMAEVAKKTHIPIATGEDVYTKWGFKPILMKEAASILQPDCSHCGGITELIRIAAMANAFDVTIAPHNPLSPLDLAAAVQASACIPNFFALETSDRGIGDPKLEGWLGSWRGVDLLKEPLKVEDGHLILPTGPGLGIELDENALAKHRTDIPRDR
jgi:galactonate dehydratase